MKAKPLDNIKVLDLTWVYAGPFATQILGDLGAEIFKIEAAPVGDKTRIMPPFKNGHSGYFAGLNRNKKSLTLDLKKEKGRRLCLELARHCDVLVENFAPPSNGTTRTRLRRGQKVQSEDRLRLGFRLRQFRTVCQPPLH